MLRKLKLLVKKAQIYFILALPLIAKVISDYPITWWDA